MTEGALSAGELAMAAPARGWRAAFPGTVAANLSRSIWRTTPLHVLYPPTRPHNEADQVGVSRSLSQNPSHFRFSPLQSTLTDCVGVLGFF